MSKGFGAALSSSRIIGFLNRSSDLVLAIFVILIIMMIIIPVSIGVIDMFIAVNLTASVALLMVSLYIPRAVQLSIFPSLLLITTLFRLGIEISATRQILLHADAGHIIQAFGEFVVGGNFVIGIIIFLIITMVQFIVVTKGAERVAEVAARFTLDAMPGKQMSIDADMRSGVIDANQGRQLRLALQKESQLYGAMDGAMKFVKGDVIAAIVIAVINIVGGLIVGIFFHGMTAMQAAQIYTLLSIGSGLVSQIPSLMISLTAGVVTTRVSSEKKETSLGSEISEQLLGQPKAIILASVVILAMATIKGFPSWIFVILSAMFFAAGYYTFQKKKRQAAAGEGAIDIDGHEVIDGDKDGFRLTVPLILELGENLTKLMEEKKGEGQKNFLNEMIPRMRSALYSDLGVRFPGVHLVKNANNCKPNEYVIKINEQPMATGFIPDGNQLLTNESPENLARYKISVTDSPSPLGRGALWVNKSDRVVLKKAGIKFWTPLEVCVLHTSQVLKRNAKEFLGIQEVRGIMQFLEKSYGELVKEVSRLIPLQRLTDIFKRLVQEQVSIRDLRTIMEAIVQWAQTEKDTVLLTEYIRAALGRYISFKYSQGTNRLAVYMLDPMIEEDITNAIRQTGSGSYLALDPEKSRQIIAAAKKTITTPPGSQVPVILTQMNIRRYVGKLFEKDFPDLVVLSTQEVVVDVQPLGRISLGI